jgi:hypothetical protein
MGARTAGEGMPIAGYAIDGRADAERPKGSDRLKAKAAPYEWDGAANNKGRAL